MQIAGPAGSESARVGQAKEACTERPRLSATFLLYIGKWLASATPGELSICGSLG